MTRRYRTRFAIVLAAVAAGPLGACANLESFSMGELPVPPDSPVAVAARDAARDPGPWPSFANMPRETEAAPSLEARAASAAVLQSEIEAMRLEAARFQPVAPEAIEAFAAEARQAVAGVSAPGEDFAAETEALARQLRARATPPPPPS